MFRLREHIDRMIRSAKAYQMDIGYTSDELVEASKEVVRANEFRSAYIRPIVFLGLGALGLDPRNAKVQTAIITWQWGAYLGEEGIRNGIRVKVSSWRRFSHDAFPNAKATGTYINSILAKRDAVIDGYDEALMLKQRRGDLGGVRREPVPHPGQRRLHPAPVGGLPRRA